MGNIFFTSDTHYFHRNILAFMDDDGELIRSFDSVEEMNERMVENWNAVVRDGDKVYHLGDVTFDYGEEFRVLMSRLRGSRRLVFGNHDKFKGTDLLSYFKKASLWRIFREYNFVCTHVPLRVDMLRRCEYNVHGHIHQNTMDDPRYINVCVEQTNYTPVALEDICARIKNSNMALPLAA